MKSMVSEKRHVNGVKENNERDNVKNDWEVYKKRENTKNEGYT